MAYDPQAGYRPPPRQHYPPQQRQPPQRGPYPPAQGYGRSNGQYDDGYGQDGRYDDRSYNQDMNGQGNGRPPQNGYGPLPNRNGPDPRQQGYRREPPQHRMNDQGYPNRPNDRRPPPQGYPYQQPQHARSDPNQPRGPPMNNGGYPPNGIGGYGQRSRPPPIERAESAENYPPRQQSRRPLIEPVSPTSMPQDNAFPMFPTPKKSSSPPRNQDHRPHDPSEPHDNGFANGQPPQSPINSPPFRLDPPRPIRQRSYESPNPHDPPQQRGPSSQSQLPYRGGPPQSQGQFDRRPSQERRGDQGQFDRRPSQERRGDQGQFDRRPSQERRGDQGYDSRGPMPSGPQYGGGNRPGQQQSAPNFSGPYDQSRRDFSGSSRRDDYQRNPNEQMRSASAGGYAPASLNLPHRPGTALSADDAARPPPRHAKSNSQSEIYANGYIDDIGRIDDSPVMSRDAQIEADMPNFGNGPNKRGNAYDGNARRSPPQQYGQPVAQAGNYPSQSRSGSFPNDNMNQGQMRNPSGGGSIGPHPANQPPKPAYYQEQYQQRPPVGQPNGGPPGQGYGPRPIPQRPGAVDQYGQPNDNQNYPGRVPSGSGPGSNGFGAPLSKQNSASSANVNPDALPQHPVPVRPGLMNGGVANQPPQGRTYPNPSEAVSPTESRRSSVQAPVTQAEINQLQSLVNAHPQDAATALLLAKKLVEASNVLASENGRLDARQTAKNRERYILDAHRRVKKLVSAGYPDAMFYLADCYGSGHLGLEEDPKEAFTLYQQAAKAGHGQAAFRTAMCCELGPEDGGGTRKDPQKAVQWYRRAAQLKDAAAMYKLGVICLKGLLGEQKNVVEAERWLKRAAEIADKDNPHALHELGLLYEPDHQDRDVRAKIIPDERYSRELFFQAAQMGFMKSQFRLGQAYEYGALGLPVDARNSIAWYSKAAAQGEHQAELALSGWYLTGAEGILQNSDQEAYLWARKAATADPPLAKAMFAMGYYTETGIGCPANMEEAKRWYGRAASYKFPKAIERLEEIKKNGGKMPKEQKGQRLQRKDIKDKVR